MILEHLDVSDFLYLEGANFLPPQPTRHQDQWWQRFFRRDMNAKHNVLQSNLICEPLKSVLSWKSKYISSQVNRWIEQTSNGEIEVPLSSLYQDHLEHVRALKLLGKGYQFLRAQDIEAIIMQQRCIRSVEILFPMLSDENLSHLLACLPSHVDLLRLTIRSANLGKRAMASLSDLLSTSKETLTTLRIESCEASDKKLAMLLKGIGLMDFPQLEVLTLSHCLVGYRSMDVLVDSAVSCGTHVPLALDLTGCSIARSGCTSISRLLQSGFPLEKLCLKDNALHNDGAMELANGLLHEKCKLRELILANCGIQCTGGTLIVSALERNQSLQVLDLSHNVLNNDHSHSFAISCGDALAVNSTLIALDLTGTLLYSIPERLKLGLSTNNTLQTLNLNENRLRTAGVSEMIQILHANATLTSIGLAGNLLHGNDALLLAQALTERKKRTKPLASLDLRLNQLHDFPVEERETLLSLLTASCQQLHFYSLAEALICDGLQEV